VERTRGEKAAVAEGRQGRGSYGNNANGTIEISDRNAQNRTVLI
jgi:hypothetical protein